MAINYGSIKVVMEPKKRLVGRMNVGNRGGGGGTNDYRALDYKPSINGHTLIGDSDFEDIGLHFMTNTELKDLLGGDNNGT